MSRERRPFFIEPRIDFPRSLRKTAPRHAARHRVLRSTNCTGCACSRAKAGLVDSRQLARPDLVRLHAAGDSADLLAGTGALKRAGHLSFRRCISRDGSSFAGNDSRLR